MRLTFILLLGFSAYGQTTAIPDVNFEQALINLGLDDVIDGGVLTSNISGVTSLNVGSSNITDLTGIQDFIALDNLECYANQLTSLDVTQNSALLQLRCQGNLLTSLDVSQNFNLEVLIPAVNQLTTLDVYQNTALTRLEIGSNQINALDLSQNILLTHLEFNLTNLTTLDVSHIPNLIWLSGAFCQLSCLNVKNGNNLNFIDFQAWNNPSLTCIEVDDDIWATANWTVAGGNIDATQSFSTNCDNACSNFTAINELTNTPKQLIKIVDFMGRETNYKPNTALIYIYSDGSRERVFKVE